MEKKKILVVDDSPEIRETFQHVIELWNEYEVRTAASGNQALSMTKSFRPDLILLDIMMPDLHGYSVCKILRSDPEFRDIKIVILSGKDYPSDIEKAKKLGADEFISKPVEPESLRNLIGMMLDLSRKDVTVEFFGTRGSIATPGKKYEKYGGNTSCVCCRLNDHLVIFDAGTGIRELGLVLDEAPVDGSILVTHSHWDHIQGFPFFVSAYDPQNIFHIYGPKGIDKSFEEIFQGQFEANYFPISMDEVYGKLRFTDLTEEKFTIEDIEVSTCYLMHPGMTIAYKLVHEGKTIVYATDNELKGKDSKYADFVKGADLLITDAQYTEDEYVRKRNWGHSSITAVIDTAMEAGVRSLALFHHDPMHDDAFLDIVDRDIHVYLEKNGGAMDCFLAKEQQEISI